MSEKLFDGSIAEFEESAKEIIALIRDDQFYQQLRVRRFRDKCQILKIEHLSCQSQHDRLQVVKGIMRGVVLRDPPERVCLAYNHGLCSQDSLILAFSFLA